MTFTQTEFWGLIVLTFCFNAMANWLRLRRATPAQWRQKRSAFHYSLVVLAIFTAPFVLSIILRLSASPPSLDVTLASLLFLLSLGIAVNELRITFQARNAGDQRSPADSNT
jgi:hypothetical protein